MTIFSWLGPSLAVLAATLVCALPWGTPGEFKLVPPLLPYVAVHLSAERRGAALPDWLVFLAGFATDVVGQGPLGFWALIYLSGYTIIRSITAGGHRGLISGIAVFAMTIVCLALMQWSVASLFYLRVVEIMPLTVAAGAALFAYAVLALVFPGRPNEPARTNDRLERGI